MTRRRNTILIIDEYGFSKICSAILERSGYATDSVSADGELPGKLQDDGVGLIVTSYPYALSCFDAIRKKNVPTIVLSDSIDDRLIDALGTFDNSFCMIKPIDYGKFKNLVQQVLNGDIAAPGGYSLV